MPPTRIAAAATSLTVSSALAPVSVCSVIFPAPGRPAPARAFIYRSDWQARRESNPQPAVLETAALPIELLACAANGTGMNDCGPVHDYFRIFDTTPGPTVRPPSRRANA